jgi:N-acetylmuramoyl-L-alanine amidase
MRAVKDINLIVIHCSATKETVDYTFEQLEKDHKARGFLRCGYHYFIRRDGTVHTGRPVQMKGAHVANHNALSVGICYEGGLDAAGKAKDTRTDSQKQKLTELIKGVLAQIKLVHGNPKKVRITGHRDLSPDLNNNGVVEPHEWVKQCPCFNAEPEYKNLPNEI